MGERLGSRHHAAYQVHRRVHEPPHDLQRERAPLPPGASIGESIRRSADHEEAHVPVLEAAVSMPLGRRSCRLQRGFLIVGNLSRLLLRFQPPEAHRSDVGEQEPKSSKDSILRTRSRTLSGAQAADRKESHDVGEQRGNEDPHSPAEIVPERADHRAHVAAQTGDFR